MSEVHFRFSTDILKRLGEELNPNPAQGLIELAKNSYDADATHCTIEIEKTKNGRSSVTIRDDGLGMDAETIENGWLMLGRSSKKDVGVTRKFKRIPAGDKGLGRLAALRMGEEVSLVTRPESDPSHEYCLQLNWTDFDSRETVEEVSLTLERKSRAPNVGHGTEIRICHFKTEFKAIDMKRLARELLLLADPFSDDPAGFNPVLVADDYKELEDLVNRRYFNDAELHLHAELNGDGQACAQIYDWKGNCLYQASHDELRGRSSEIAYNCPAVCFDMWVFVLDSASFSVRTTTVQEVQAWLKEFGGVYLYSQGLRIAPYGDAGNDWLDINLSRVRSPELRPSTNTALGRVVVKDAEEKLVQKTDRSGFLENEYFLELKGFSVDALNWMARRRIEERDNKRRKELKQSKDVSSSSSESLNEAIDKLPKAQREDFKKKFDKHEDAHKRETTALRKEVQLYRTMSTIGITSAIASHESKQPVTMIGRDTNQIERIISKRLPEEVTGLIGKQIRRIQNQTSALKAFADMPLSLSHNEKRRSSRVDIHQTVRNVLELFELYASQRQTVLQTEFDTGIPYIMGTEAAIESIVTNLVINSLKAFGSSSPRKRLIQIETELQLGAIVVRFLDNGPGIKDISLNDIWLPGETRFETGTGLGLTIVRDTVSDLGGVITAKESGRLGGAEFVLELPIIMS